MQKVNNNLSTNNCPLCNAISIDRVGLIDYASPLYYSTEEVIMLCQPELWKCNNCYSSFVQNAVNEIDSISLYSKGNAEERWSHSPTFEESKTKIVVNKIKSLLNRDIQILDVGCNTGELLDLAKRYGCKTFGVEYSLTSLKVLKEKSHIAYSSIQEVKSLFRIITAFDLVEHLYNLPEFLNICFDKLQSDGYLVILTGDIGCLSARITGAKWWYVRYPEHIIFPSKKYFAHHPKFQLIDWIPTYAGLGYKQPLVQALKSTTKYLIKGMYSGSPSLVPDHTLIVLKRKDSS